MSDIAIRIDGLSKQYRIGRKQEGYKTLRDTLAATIVSPLRRVRSLLSGQAYGASELSETIWALKDVSLEIKRGEVVGIIGPNGAGKTTLLKILSRITEPTEGQAEIYGRVGSLLEVGTGFHPELTGRENIYLNGAILGMKKAEIAQKFDEIVAFAEIEEFIDTPVKHYSSGMYVRLAFAVAAHLEPEILLVDEVLAVGDAAFQKKCLGKMEDVADQGRTVLFVSHNMAAVQRLCNTGILLNSGKTLAAGSASKVTELYLQEVGDATLSWERLSSEPTSEAYFTRIYLSDEKGEKIEQVITGSLLSVTMEFTVAKRSRNLQLSIGLLDGLGNVIFGSAPQDAGLVPPEEIGNYRAIIRFPPEILLAKTYGIKAVLWITEFGVIDSVNSLRFPVQETASFSNLTPGVRSGTVAVRCNWSLVGSD
jgi:lipopolysaccharide transport system ATP-binding protein